MFLAEISEEFFISVAFCSTKTMIKMSNDDSIFRVYSHRFREQIHTIWSSGTRDNNSILGGDIIFLEEFLEHVYWFFKSVLY